MSSVSLMKKALVVVAALLFYQFGPAMILQFTGRPV